MSEPVTHECSMRGLINGWMGDDGVMRCAHGYPMPEGTRLQTDHGTHVVGKAEPARGGEVPR